MSRQDQTYVSVTIDWPGLGNLGVWENRTGGKGDSDSTKHREGGMGPQLAYGGPQTIDNASVERRFDPLRDGSILKALYAARGRARMTIVEVLLDEHAQPWAVGPNSWSGKLKSVDSGEANANSNDIRMISLEQDTDQFA